MPAQAHRNAELHTNTQVCKPVYTHTHTPHAHVHRRATAARVLGVVPLRIFLVCVYLLLLHITVMVSGYRQSHN